MSKTIVKHEILEVYKYKELSERAKEKAKENYLTNYRNAYEFKQLVIIKKQERGGLFATPQEF